MQVDDLALWIAEGLESLQAHIAALLGILDVRRCHCGGRTEDGEEQPSADKSPWHGSVLRESAPVELDRHNAQHVFPVGLVAQNLPQLRLGGLAGEKEIKRLVERLRTGERVDPHEQRILANQG
jgi:hypothetical protein